MALLLWLAIQDLGRGLEGLGSTDVEVRERAVRRLVQAGRASVPLLLDGMSSSDPEVRGRAEEAILKIGLDGVPALDAAATPLTLGLARRIIRTEAELHLRTEYSVLQWGEAPPWRCTPELELGEGYGHGSDLNWSRFRPAKDHVEYLNLALSLDRKSYSTRWPPDRASLELTRGAMSGGQYSGLLRVVAELSAARLEATEQDRFGTSTADFWVFARVAGPRETLFEDEYAGYRNTRDEHRYARARAIRDFVVQRPRLILSQGPATLTAGERAWVSMRFSGDWKRMEKDESAWWVRERSLILVGLGGDESALPVLKDILKSARRDRCTYHAINAVTRLLGMDVRGSNVEDMDIEAVRERVLKLLER